MITHFYRSKFDIENLSRLKTLIPDTVDRADYKRVVVNKPWGYEYLMYENDRVAIWALHLNADHQTSMHCHPNKKTSLIVISGTVVCSTLDGWVNLKTGDGVIIEEAVFHSTKAVSKKGAMIIEIESPPNKKDLVRLKDAYGRESDGYEGKDKMSHDVKKYQYIDFHTDSHVKTLVGCNFSLVTCSRHQDLTQKIKEENAHVFCLLSGKIHDRNGLILLREGESETLEHLKRNSRLEAFSDIVYLTLWYV